jgi:dTMP kinase
MTVSGRESVKPDRVRSLPGQVSLAWYGGRESEVDMSGLFITFEGVDGVGKTTQVERLCGYIEGLGREVVVTREPGGTPLGAQLRRLLLEGDDVSPYAEALLFAADRAEHVAKVIRPALTRGAVVVSDRYIDSSLAYQSGGRELTAEEVENLSMWATNDLLPTRTYLLDMDPLAARERLKHDADRMESTGVTFALRTRQAFLDLARRDPGRFCVVDAAQSVEDIWAQIKRDVTSLLDVS